MDSSVTEAAERKLAAAHQVLKHTRGLQLDFAAAPPPPPTPSWVKAVLHALEFIAPAMRYVFWAGVIAGGIFLLWVAIRDAVPLRYRRKAKPAPMDWRPAPQVARALLEEADGLAAGGRFSEAIHLILFRSIEDLASRLPGAVPAASTSRDIAASPSIPEAARGAFARIAHTVEISFFGGQTAQADDFRRCREDYEAFAFEEAWR